MGLIKSIHAPTSLQTFSMKDVEAQANAVLLRARKRAEELLAAAQREGEELKELAKADGSREGFEQGRASGLKLGREAGLQQALAEHRPQLTEALEALRSAMEQIDAGRRDLETEGLREVVQLAAAVARRVTKRQGMLDEGVLAANLADAMKLTVQGADVRIAVHPRQRRTLEECLPKLHMEFPNFRHTEIVEDDTLAPGGCRIFTRGGRVDADLDGQLDRVIDELLPKEKSAE